jgi:hypothetical protein
MKRILSQHNIVKLVNQKKMEQPTTPPVDERDEAFENLRSIILEAPLKADYKIDLLNALSAYIKTLN